MRSVVYWKDRHMNRPISAFPPLSSPQAAIAASGRTLPTCRSKPSGRLCCACTTLSWWTDTSPPLTTPRWFTPLTTPSSDTRGDDSEGERRHRAAQHPDCLTWSSNSLGHEFRETHLRCTLFKCHNCLSLCPFFLNTNEFLKMCFQR